MLLHSTPVPSMPKRTVRLAAAGALLLASLLSRPEGAGAAARAFAIDPLRSRVVVHVGKGGLFKFAGHEHEVVAPLREGEVVADASDLTRSSVRLAFDAAALRLEGEGETPGDVAKIQETMAGSGVLDVPRFAQITFQSDKVSGREISRGVLELAVSGLMQIRGHKERLTLNVRVETLGDTLVATGTTALRQSSFGITPVSVAGVVKVKDELAVDFRFEGRAPALTPPGHNP